MWKIILFIRLPIAIYERFENTLEPFFVPDFDLLSLELDAFTFKVLY